MNSYWEVFIYFFRLGLTGFGGPLALVSMMQRDLVDEKKWMTPTEFAQGLSLLKAMPGALAFQTAVFAGRHRAGFWGGTIAGISLLLPASVLMVFFAKYYEWTEKIGGLRSFFNGMQAGAVVLMVQGLRSLAIPYFKEKRFWFFFLTGGIVFYLDVIPEPLLILGAGGIGILLGQKRKMTAFLAVPLGIAPAATAFPQLLELAWTCFKSGAVVFGTGLAIVPLLEREFVHRLGWLTSQQFLDAVALGQVTPGPVLVTVTFIGYLVQGGTGALVGTVTIFLPGFIHMQTWFPHVVSYLGRQKWVNDFLIPCLGVICGVLLITIFRLTIGWGIESTELSVISLICALLMIVMKIPSWMLILIAGGMAILI